MERLITRFHNGVALDCYKAEQETDGFWATREQIGVLLGYENPRLSVANIHNRNRERLDKFSTVIKLVTVEGDRSVEREMTVYNFKGFLEICRFSNQPNANAVIDFAWSVMDEIRRTGFYCVKTRYPLADVLAANRIVLETAGLKGNQLALATDKVLTHYTGQSTLALVDVQLEASEKCQLLTPTMIGQELGISARRVNEILAGMGYQHKIAGEWEPLGRGVQFAVMLDTNKKHSDGVPVRQLKWNSEILEIVRERI